MSCNPEFVILSFLSIKTAHCQHILLYELIMNSPVSLVHVTYIITGFEYLASEHYICMRFCIGERKKTMYKMITRQKEIDRKVDGQVERHRATVKKPTFLPEFGTLPQVFISYFGNAQERYELKS